MGLYSGSQRTIKKCPAVAEQKKRPLPGLEAAGEVEQPPDKQDGKVDKPDQARASDVVADCIRFKLFRIAVSVVLVSSR